MLNSCPPSSMPRKLVEDFSWVQSYLKHLHDEGNLQDMSEGQDYQHDIGECKRVLEEVTGYVAKKKDFLQR